MRFSLTLAALGAYASTTFADTSVPEGYTLEQEYTGKSAPRNAHHDMRRAWLRYNGTVPQHIEEAAAGKSKGSVKTTPEKHDQLYFTPVHIGTPGKTHHMDIDTGSSDLWVFGTNLPAKTKQGHTIYQPASSKTSKQMKGSTWAIHYGDGSTAGGNVYTDKVTVAGIVAPKQAVESANRVASSFARDKQSDGIFGFGFNNNNDVRPNKVKTWISNVGPKLANNVFCANLNYHKPGSYDIGFINPAHHTGPVHYKKITRAHGYWEFSTDGYVVKGDKYNADFAHAIADTGTSLLYAPPSAVRNYYKHVPSAQFNRQVAGYIFKCSTKLPDFTVIIGGSPRVVQGKFINYLVAGTIGSTPYCLGGIQESPQQGLTILGDIFLKSQYVVFDQGNSRIGFAHKK